MKTQQESFLPRLRFGCTNSRSECHFLCCSKMQSAAALEHVRPLQPAGELAHPKTLRQLTASFDDSQLIVKHNHSNKNEPFCSQPISDHGVGTVRPWAAVNLNIAHRRHNVSARDGGLPASRRTGAGAFLCALLRPLLLNARPTIMPVHSSNPPSHRLTDAVTHACVPAAGRPTCNPRTGHGVRSGFFFIQRSPSLTNLKFGGARLCRALMPLRKK
jgi:hypothetical protein